MSKISLSPDAAQSEDLPNEGWNFRALVGDVASFFIGIGFLDGATALPALVGQLGGGAAFVGFLLALKQGGYFLPQLFVAHKLQHQTRYKPFLLKVSLAGRLGYVLAALAVWQVGLSHPTIALGILAGAYFLGWFCDGAGGVPWTALVGRMVSNKKRGRLFAATQIISGFSRLAVGAVVALLLGGKLVSFPASGGLLVGGCALFLLISWGFLALLREPEASQSELPETPDAVPLSAYLKALPQKFRQRPDVARLAVVQVLAGAAGSAAPFITLAAGDKSLFIPPNLPLGIGHLLALLPANGLPGLFLIAQTVGLLMLAPVWGILTDKYGPRISLLCLVGLALWVPVAGIWGVSGLGRLSVFLSAFWAFGSVVDGWITITNYLLEAVPEGEQPAYIGLLNTASIPALLIPFACGLVFRELGPTAAFVLCGVLLFVAFLFAWSLPDTRRAKGTA